MGANSQVRGLRGIMTEPQPYACGDAVTRVSSLVTYSFAHFCVDLSCAMLVMGIVVPAIMEGTGSSSFDVVATANIAIVLYNMLAFVLQLPVGMVADRVDDNPMVSAWGCATVMVAYMLSGISPFLAAVVAGIGNAMFHVGGGVDTLNMSGTKRADMSGVFVSTGAMGLFLGMGWDKLSLPLPELPLSLLALSGIALIGVRRLARARGTRVANESPEAEFSGMPGPVRLLLAGMFVTVAIRSLLGFSVAFPWKTDIGIGIAVTSMVVLGKMLGGVVGDRIGWKRTAIVSLPVASFLFLFSYDSMSAGLLAMLLFNMTMPLTLTVLADAFRHNKGAAFGITTVALFLGGWSLGVPFLSSPAGVSLMCLVSFGTILLGFSGYEAMLSGWEFSDGAWRARDPQLGAGGRDGDPAGDGIGGDEG